MMDMHVIFSSKRISAKKQRQRISMHLKLQNANVAKQKKEIYEAAKDLAEELSDKSITAYIKTGEGGRAFGSVSTKEISAEIESQLGLSIDNEKDGS